MTPDADPRLEALLAAAEQHGLESEPDHEVGDLQDLLRACWSRLGEHDRAALYDELPRWPGGEP